MGRQKKTIYTQNELYSEYIKIYNKRVASLERQGHRPYTNPYKSNDKFLSQQFNAALFSVDSSGNLVRNDKTKQQILTDIVSKQIYKYDKKTAEGIKNFFKENDINVKLVDARMGNLLPSQWEMIKDQYNYLTTVEGKSSNEAKDIIGREVFGSE